MNGKSPRKNPKPGRSKEASATSSTPLVGLGASAVSTDGVLRFFENAKSLSSAAFVLVLQRSEALEGKAFADALRAASGMAVETPKNGQPPQAGRIYLGTSNTKLTLADGVFRVAPAQELPGGRATIDSFLISLAGMNEGAIGVVLADTGGDGTLGLTALKESGSLSFAELPKGGVVEGPHGNLAKNASAIADFVLPADIIASKVAEHLKTSDRVRVARDFDDLVEESAAQLTRIATVLRNQTGHDFHGYKRNTFLRRVQRRIQVTQTGTIDGYLEYLKAVPDEAQGLFNDLLIGVTHFFRDQKEFEYLEREIVPKLFEGKNAGDQLRVWVLGCATGEEAYSIAILLREHMARLDSVPHIQIFATDIDGRALAQARVGRYGEASIREVTPERLARWFVKEGDTYCVVKELREMCIFSQHNIIKDAPFSRLDLVSCRNLLIYLGSELQNRVIPLFHFSLRQGGYLFLGNSENVTRHSKLFAPVDRRFRIFRQQESLVRVLPDFPLTATAERRPAVEQGTNFRAPGAGVAALTKQAERIMERYAPAYMIIDENYDVLHFSGRTGRYIDPPTGIASLNLLSLIHRDLRMDLRAALHKIEADKRPVHVTGLKVGQNGHSINVALTVEALETGAGYPTRYAVVLQDGHIVQDHDETGERKSSAGREIHHANVERLEAELQLTRDRLQATIEELESTNEELKASNEEYQSVNEELQSSNEELETSKEELQSLNEELQTVNGELAHRVEELGRANSDLKNLLESTQIATVFLDNDLRVKSFTPAITELFHLIESDLGRPINHIAARIAYDDLESDVRKVLRTLSTIERETKNAQTGSRYLTRVLPYRSVDNVIEGVVMTFLDVTPLFTAEEKLRESEERLRTVVEGISQLVWRAREQGNWTWSSPQWTTFTGQSSAAAVEQGWLEMVHPEDRERVVQAWAGASDQQGLVVDHRLYYRPNKDYRNVQTRALPVKNGRGETVEWVGTSTDVHELMLLQHRQNMLLSELQHRVRNTLAVIRSIARRSAESSDNVEDYAIHLEGRIDALARAHSVLTREPDATVDLQNLLLEEFDSQGARDGRQVTLTGPDIALAGKAAEDLGLVFHELVTNAVKYGALRTDAGKIDVNWKVAHNSEPQRLVIRWSEVPESPITPPARTGFGAELIERVIPHELNGASTMDFESSGMKTTIELPLSDLIRASRRGRDGDA